MKKTKDMASFFDLIDLLKEYDYDKLYNKLIYGNDIINNDIDALFLIYEKIDCGNKNIIDNKIIICEGLDNNKDNLLMELNFLVNLENTDNVISELIMYLKKRKIKYIINISLYNNLCDIKINLLDRDYLVKLVDYINDKLGKKIERINPLIFGDEKVGLSCLMDYSYNEILVMYIDKFLKSNKNINYNSFKKFILDYYFKITNQVSMDNFIEFNKKDILLSRFYKNIEVVTTLIVYLINEKDMEDYNDYFKKLKKEENKNVNTYLEYDDLSYNVELFKELVISMCKKYGLEYCKNSMINYRDTGNKGYITRTNDLRKRVVDAKTFLIYLKTIDLDLEFKNIGEMLEFDNKKKILEDVCKETYMNCNDVDINNSGKIQVARTLIRISFGDYSSVTRCNNARKMAKENIKPDEVVKLIKETLNIDYVKKESTLYELYADYIMNLCLV